MKILELFSGTGSFSKVARELGHETFTIDFDKSFNPDLCLDISLFDISMLPDEFRNPDIIWASPPCQKFSVASLSRNWKDGKPTNEETKQALFLVYKTFEIIKELKPKYWFIENPRGMLRKCLELKPITVSYCQYGDKRMKPTDIWTNSDFKGKLCKNGDSCHERAPRGSRTGTQGLKNAKDRGVIPRQLCLEIFNTLN